MNIASQYVINPCNTEFIRSYRFNLQIQEDISKDFKIFTSKF